MSTHYDKETIGPMLTRLRQSLSYSLTEVAQQLCARSGHPTVTRHEVARWERQDRIPTEFWLRWLAEVLSVPIDLLREAVAAARGRPTTPGIHHLNPDDPAGDMPPGPSWLAVQHGPIELLIALSAVEVDRLRTVLAPVNPPEPATPAGNPHP